MQPVFTKPSGTGARFGRVDENGPSLKPVFLNGGPWILEVSSDASWLWPLSFHKECFLWHRVEQREQELELRASTCIGLDPTQQHNPLRASQHLLTSNTTNAH
uniref:Uncharacterized protein n=1 Tax=Knipowitschia caucasica TaxID=637954 RepID=A0AAV2KLV0_KNICA